MKTHPDAALLAHLVQCVQAAANLDRNLTDEELVRFLVPTKEGQRAVLQVCRAAQQQGVLKQVLSLAAYQCVLQILTALDEGTLGESQKGHYALMRADPDAGWVSALPDLHEFIGDAMTTLGLDPPRADLTVLD